MNLTFCVRSWTISPPLYRGAGRVSHPTSISSRVVHSEAELLAITGGNQTKAADLLGIQRSSLNRQMKELYMREEESTD